ncbi:MAG: FtsX-like permease family protein, partial [Acholeplasmatales bacterium]|nr:FtsX-like permease family protein [Acholeplasmatales bacterium]
FARLNNTLVYESEGAVTMKISGVLRQKKSVQTSINGSGFYYTKELTEHIFNNGFTSDIVLKQMSNPTIDVFNGSTISAATYTRRLQELGGSKLPYEIRIYPTTYQARDKITEYLNHYNDNFSKEEKEQMVLLENYDEIVGASVKVLVKGITAVLVVLAGISLVVSSVMIGIITYVSVMERTQEIGILRSVGARKLDIVSVFSSETFFIGLTSGILGIAVSLILSPITSMILEKMTTINSLSIITLPSCILLIVSSILLTLVAGSIPSAIASLKNPVECLKKVD